MIDHFSVKIRFWGVDDGLMGWYPLYQTIQAAWPLLQSASSSLPLKTYISTPYSYCQKPVCIKTSASPKISFSAY